MIYGQPLLVADGDILYAEPGARRFYHLSKQCPCFRRGGADKLQELSEAQAEQRHLQPCFFCGYSPDILTRRERILEVITAPLGLLHLPAGILGMIAFMTGFLVGLNLHNEQVLPLWSCIMVGVGITGLGIFLDSRLGWME